MSVFKVGSNKSSQNNFPSVRPTLDLDFANSKTLDPRITFTRASGGSYVGADGLIKLAGVNEPRFDHDPVTGESLGLLVEEAKTNLVTYSEQFDNANWTKSSTTVTANATTAPDGTLTADRLLETAVTSSFYVGAFYVTTTPGTYTFSVYAKGDGSGRLLNMVFYNGFYAQSYFNLSTGVVSNVDAGLTASIQSLPNGWFRCSVTGDYYAFLSILLYSAVAAGESSVYTARAGSASAGLFLWGCQGEAGAFPTSYIPTEASTRTRAADDAQITGKNFSSWYNQSEGTIFSQFYLDSNRTNTRWVASVGAISTSGSGNTGFIIGRVAPDYLYAECRVNTTPQYSATASFPSSRIAKISYGLKNADQRVAFNGTLASESTGSFAPLSQNRMDIGSLLGIEYLCGTISRLTYYPKRLTDAQLQVLTR